MLLEKLEAIKIRFENVEREISNPETMKDMKRFAALNREYKDLQYLMEKFGEYKNVLTNLEHAREVIANEKDKDFRELAEWESELLGKRVEELEEEIRMLPVPAAPEDAKNAIVEIRAGTGGDE